MRTVRDGALVDVAGPDHLAEGADGGRVSVLPVV